MSGPWRVDTQVAPSDTAWFATEEAAEQHAAMLVKAGTRNCVVWCDWATYEGGAA